MTASKSRKVRIREFQTYMPGDFICHSVTVEVRVFPSRWIRLKRWDVEDCEDNPEDVTYARNCAEELYEAISKDDSVE